VRPRRLAFLPLLAAFGSAASVSAPSAFAQSARTTTPSELVTIADRVFDQYNNTHGPGCAVGIARGGTTLLERGYGMADMAGNRPITPQTILESGSVAKQFTATAVLLLAHDGKLSLDDDARKYLPELPVYGRTITVRHLLTHTTGLREWSNLVALQGWPRGTRVHTNPDMVRLIAAQRALNYDVGDHYSYTNSGFLLAHAIVERVSGQSFQQFTRDRIFVPLGMTHSSWRDDFTRIVPGLAQAYRRVGSTWKIDMPGDNVVGAGGLWTTVGDWLRWNNALTNKTLGAAVVDPLTQQMHLTNGLEIAYALGIVVSRYRGTPQIAHSGSTAGYSTYLARYPALGDLSIAVMCNAAGAPATSLTTQLVDALHPELPAAAPLDTVTADQSALLAWRGVYEDSRWRAITRVDTANGVLRANGAPVRMLRGDMLQVAGQRVRPTQSAAGGRTLRGVTSDGDSTVLTWRAAPGWTPTAAELAVYVGRFRSDEVENTVRILVKNGQLALSTREGDEDLLTPTYRDHFEAGGNVVWFGRDSRGRLSTLHLGESRMWDMVLTRLKD
jgi:CubicO group peptidase (beta-lactamase class C family)